MQTQEQHHPLNDYLLSAANHILKQTVNINHLNGSNVNPTHSKVQQTTQLHPLSFNRPLQTTKQNVINSLTSIQQTLNSFKQLLPQQQSQNNNNLAIRKLFALLRESSHHLNLLIQSNSLINLNQTQLHPPSNYLNPSIILQNIPADQRFPTTLHLIESVTRHIGLESFRDSDHSNLLTIAGKLIVIDVELLTNQTDSNPVTRSKFSYTFAGELEPRRDALIDQELTQILSNVHLIFQSQPPHSFCDMKKLELVKTSLNGFTESLLRLKELDELMKFHNHPNGDDEEPGSGTSASSIDFFRVFRQLINDYHQSYQDYLNNKKLNNSGQATDSDHVVSTRQLPSTGIPLTSIHQFKLELLYHSNSSSSLNPNPSQLLNGNKISISPTPLTTNQDTCSNIDFAKYDKLPIEQNQPERSKALFTAYFSPPLVVSRHTAAALALVSYNATTPPSSIPLHALNGDDFITDNSSLKDEIWIEDLLVYLAMLPNSSSPTNPSHSENEFGSWLEEPNWKIKKFGKKFDEKEGVKSIKQIYSSLEGTPVESGDLNDRIGFSISKIGFNDLNSLLKIVKICQRQSILNELFQSCFNRDSYLEHLDQSSKQRSIDCADEFETFYITSPSDYKSDLGDGVLGSGHVDTGDKETNEVLIDILMNQWDYSITIQFILAAKSKKTSEEMNRSNQANDDNDDTEVLNNEIEKMKLISLKIQVTEDLDINLMEFDQSISLTPVINNDYNVQLSATNNLPPLNSSNTSGQLNHSDDNDKMMIDDNQQNNHVGTCCYSHSSKETLQSHLVQNLSIPLFLNLILQKLI